MNSENALRHASIDTATQAAKPHKWSLLSPRTDPDTRDERVPSSANSLNAMRLAFALVVVISHVPIVRGMHAIFIGDLEIGGWAVAGFFVISGWLVTQSRLRLSFWNFLWRRCLRIFPGFWACLIATAFIAAPIAALAGPGHWRLVAALRYVSRDIALHVFQPGIGTTLQGVPDPSTWNLSLWTLPYEFACYLGVGLLLTFTVARRRPSVVVVAFVVVTVVQAALIIDGTNRATTLQLSFRLATFFLAGALLARCQRIRLTGFGALLSLAVLVVVTAFDDVRMLAALPVAYLCMWLGRVLPLRSVGRTNDVSYGVYVYAWPIQQLLMFTVVARWQAVWFGVISTAITLPVAFLSWRFVEHPALRLKTLRQPSRTLEATAAPQPEKSFAASEGSPEPE
jgi:peptidoglycan/LPS O-acetylase OafA/YrhL